jgi:hypothetical protein
MGLAPSTFSFRVHRPLSLSLSHSLNTTLFSPIPLDKLLNLKPVTGLASDRSYRRDQYQHQPAWANIIETRLQRTHIRDQYPLDSIRLSDYDSKPGTKRFEASEIDSVSFEHILQHGDLSGRSLDKDGWV